MRQGSEMVRKYDPDHICCHQLARFIRGSEVGP
jgi:hypothetical protein